MQVEVIDSGSIDSVRLDGWQHLFQSTPGARFYLHPHWLQTVSTHLYPQGLKVGFLYEQEQLQMVMPLVDGPTKSRPCHPAHDHLSLNDLLIHPELANDRTRMLNAISSVLATESKSWSDWQMSNVPHQSALIQNLLGDKDATDANPDNSLEINNVVNLNDSSKADNWKLKQTRQSASFDCTSENCPPHAKLRRNLRRLRNQLQEDGEITVEQVTERQALDDAFDVFLTTESSGWKGTGQEATAIAANPELTAFYRGLLDINGSDTNAVINLLWRDKDCCAVQFGIRTGQCLSLLKIGYNEAFSRYSPGYLLLESVLASAKEQNIDTLSLVTSPPWSERWHPDVEPVWHVNRFNNNNFGTALRQYDKLKDAAKSRIKRQRKA